MDKALELKKMLNLLDPDRLTREEFVQAFEKVVEVVQQLRTSNASDISTALETLQDTIQKAQNSLESDVSSQLSSAVDKLNTALSETLTKADKKLSDLETAVATAIDGIRHGKDADEEAMLAKLQAIIPTVEPETADSIRNKLEAGFLDAPEEDKLDPRIIQGWEKTQQDIQDLKSRPMGKGGGGLSQLALQQAMGKLIKHEDFSTSSSTTYVDLANKVSGNVVIWVRYNGQMLRYADDFTISGKRITFIPTLADNTTVEVTYLAA